MKAALATAFVAFVTAVTLLTSHYKTEWPAPNFVTHSSTFDWFYQLISAESQVEYSYSHISDPLPIVSSNLVDLTSDEQLIQEKQSSLYHLLHIPPWALVPDRIISHEGTVAHLYNVFDTISQRWKDTLSLASDNIDVSPTKSLMRSHMESLSKSEKYWIKNISQELFNCSQLIFSYQMIQYADEIEFWIQNSEHSNNHLRFHFERTRGWPLFYTPFTNNKILENAWNTQTQTHESTKSERGSVAGGSTDSIDYSYFDICSNIIDSMNEIMDENSGNSHEDMPEMSLKECEVILDLLLPWLPDRPMTLSAMWPMYENILLNMNELLLIEGVNSSFTQVIKQNHRPSSDVPLHYVSLDGSERIRVEWFINELHYRATNIAFVRRIRTHMKRMTSALRISIGKEDPPDADDWEAFFAQYDPDAQPTVDPRVQQLNTYLVDFLDYFCNETEKGQFDKVLSSDLSQDLNIFFHGLPSIAPFRDNGMKRVWNMIIGVWDKNILNLQSIDITESVRNSDSTLPDHNTKLFINFYNMLSDSLDINNENILLSKRIALEIVPVWPYTVGGWLRAQTPELAFYSYPNHVDSMKYGIKRCVLLLDVIVQIYSNNMRSIGDNKFLQRNDAKLITLQSILQYISNMLMIQHSYFYDEYSIMFPFNSELSGKEGSFIRLGALLACNDINGGMKESENMNDDIKGCILSGIMYNLIDGFVRENEYSQYLMIFLDEVDIFKQVLIDENGNTLKSSKITIDFDKLLNENEWNKWKMNYFDENDEKFSKIFKNMILDYYLFKFEGATTTTTTITTTQQGRRKKKRKREEKDRNIIDQLYGLVRNIPKYSIVARPGEDSYTLDDKN